VLFLLVVNLDVTGLRASCIYSCYHLSKHSANEQAALATLNTHIYTMGFLSTKKSKNNSDIVPLNERDHTQYKVKQVVKVGKSKSHKEAAVLMLTEEGAKVMDAMTHDVMYTLPWREMMWFEVRPATKEWVIHTKKTSKYEDKIRFITSEAIRIHAEAEMYLDRFIRNYKLAQFDPLREPDTSCVQELIDEANSVNTLKQLSMAKSLAVGGGGN